MQVATFGRRSAPCGWSARPYVAQSRPLPLARRGRLAHAARAPMRIVRAVCCPFPAYTDQARRDRSPAARRTGMPTGGSACARDDAAGAVVFAVVATGLALAAGAFSAREVARVELVEARLHARDGVVRGLVDGGHGEADAVETTGGAIVDRFVGALAAASVEAIRGGPRLLALRRQDFALDPCRLRLRPRLCRGGAGRLPCGRAHGTRCGRRLRGRSRRDCIACSAARPARDRDDGQGGDQGSHGAFSLNAAGGPATHRVALAPQSP
jgi:hypothetical protein